MKKILIFLVGFFLGLIVFMPKDNLYFTLQKYLSKENIYINSDIYSFVNLNLKKGTIYYNGMDLVAFDKVIISPFIFFNKIEADNIKIKFQNLKIKKIDVVYSIINPLKVYIKGSSNFGEIDGYIDLIKRQVKIYILNLNSNFLKSLLKKDKKGYFYYVSF